mgnify:CR=1 FL=1
MIIGAGGSCRSIAVELASNNVELIEIRNRSEEKANNITSILNEHFDIKAQYSTKKIESFCHPFL